MTTEGLIIALASLSFVIAISLARPVHTWRLEAQVLYHLLVGILFGISLGAGSDTYIGATTILLASSLASQGIILYRTIAYKRADGEENSSWLDLSISQVMVSRPQVILIEESELDDLEALKVKLLNYPYTRYPVVNNGKIVGVLSLRDVMKGRDVLRSAFVVPDRSTVGRALQQFKKGRSHLAVVVDEYGEWQGIVTLEDVLEELVGDIKDEIDPPEYMERNIMRDQGGWRIRGSVTWYDAITLLQTKYEELPSEWGRDKRYSTVAGHVFSLCDQIPSPGDVINDLDGWRWVVRERVGNRLEWVHLSKNNAE